MLPVESLAREIQCVLSTLFQAGRIIKDRGNYLCKAARIVQTARQEAAQAIQQYGFEKLNLMRLICLIDAENKASVEVARKIGMTFEKESRDEMVPFMVYTISNNPDDNNKRRNDG